MHGENMKLKFIVSQSWLLLYFITFVLILTLKDSNYLRINIKRRFIFCVCFYVCNFKFKSKTVNWYLVFTGIIL